MASTTILLTGGTGFIGKALTFALLESGARVFVLTRTPTRAEPHLAESLTYIPSLDVMHGVSVDTIINLAGETISQRWSLSAKEEILNSRLRITQQIIHYIARSPSKPRLLISGSAVGYYGTSTDSLYTEESAPSVTGDDFARDVCISWEQEAKKAEDLGVRTVLLRMGVVLEKDGGMLSKLHIPFRLGLGGTMGSGEQWLSWIDREDLIQLILFVISHDTMRGAINATAPEVITNATFCRTLANTLRRPCAFIIPSIVLRTVLGEMADKIMLHGQQVVPQKALSHGFVFRYPTLSSSLNKIFAM